MINRFKCGRLDDMDNKSFNLVILFLIICIYLFMGVQEARGQDKNSSTQKMTTCRLASQILGNNQRVCVFLGANNTQYREYVPYDAGECPKEYQCPYRPNEKPFNLKNVIKSIKKQFRE